MTEPASLEGFEWCIFFIVWLWYISVCLQLFDLSEVYTLWNEGERDSYIAGIPK